MTIQEFKENYSFRITSTSNDVQLALITEVIRLSDNIVLDKIKGTFDIYETNNWVSDSRANKFAVPWTWVSVLNSKFNPFYKVRKVSNFADCFLKENCTFR